MLVCYVVARVIFSANSAAAAMKQAGSQVKRRLDLASRGTGMLDQIHQSAIDSLAKVQDVAHATSERSTTATDIARHVEQIAAKADETSAATQQNAVAAERLEPMASELRQMVDYFRAG